MWIAIFIFCSSAGLLVYVLAGYPLLLNALATRCSRPVAKDAVLRSASIIIAVRNGEKFLAEKLDSLLALDYPKELLEITVVSDGSEDGTDEIAALYSDSAIRLVRMPRAGKAVALNLGISQAGNEILILTDVRQRLHPQSLRRLIACFGDPEVGAASGELSILRGETDEEANTRRYWSYELWMRKNMSRLDSTLGATGPFYAIRRSLAVRIPPDTILDDVYLPLAAFFRGYRIVLEESAKAFDYPTDLQSEFGRKVRTLAGLLQLLSLCPELLKASNRMRFHFFSGKYARLAMPWLLIFVAISSPWLPVPLNRVAAAAQIIFYGSAVIDPLLAGASWLKRFTSPIRTFVVLSVAALMALRIFFVKPGALWKQTKVRKVNG